MQIKSDLEYIYYKVFTLPLIIDILKVVIFGAVLYALLQYLRKQRNQDLKKFSDKEIKSEFIERFMK